MNPEEIVPEGAFAGVPRLRHVSIESGIRFIGADAWQNCRQLRIVKLPTTVVGISDNVFRNCKLLNSVSAPGCRQFGYKAFAECCSLQWVYAAEGAANRFSDTKFGHYLFQGCINLAEFTLQELHPLGGGVLTTAASNLALGCLSSTGITMLTLTQGFTVIGAHACDSCHLLKQVDLSNTKVEEIQEFTFAHCTSLKEVSFPPTLQTIRVKAFMNCAFFPRVRTPCGHGAQVIVEGREEKTDGGERNEDPKKPTQKPNTQARRPTPPSCSLPYTLGETCETETSDN